MCQPCSLGNAGGATPIRGARAVVGDAAAGADITLKVGIAATGGTQEHIDS